MYQIFRRDDLDHPIIEGTDKEAITIIAKKMCPNEQLVGVGPDGAFFVGKVGFLGC